MSGTKELRSIAKAFMLQEAVTKTADFAGTEVDIGIGAESAIAILHVSVCDMTTGDETYQFGINHSDTAGGTYSAAGTFTLIATPSVASWQQLSLTGLKRYVKLGLDVEGTTPSATYTGEIVVTHRGALPVA
jgi:hypothetical protein